jgi:hypothetical protein
MWDKLRSLIEITCMNLFHVVGQHKLYSYNLSDINLDLQ